MPPQPQGRSRGIVSAEKDVKTKPKSPTKRDICVLRNLENSKLLSLPVEIHTMIFRNLDKCSSTCLALTTKTLYPIHFSLRGKVPLNAFWIDDPENIWSGKILRALLNKWVSQRGLEFYMAPVGSTSLKGVAKMITIDKQWVGGRKLVGLSGQKRKWDQEWRRRGVAGVEAHQAWKWSDEFESGYNIAKKLLGGYEENGTWFYA